MTTDTVSQLTTDITAALVAYGDSWKPRWAACKNAMQDTYGNSVSIHHTDGGYGSDTVRIEFEYALGGMVETMNLNPAHGARRIAAVIDALAAAPTE